MTKRRTIQAPILSYMLSTPRPVRRAELHEVIGGSMSSLSGALSRLKGNGILQRNEDGTWIIIDTEEAKWLTKYTYHTKTRERPAQVGKKGQGPKVVGVMEQPSPNGELRMGDLFEMIGHLPDGSQLVRTLDNGIVYKLEEV